MSVYSLPGNLLVVRLNDQSSVDRRHECPLADHGVIKQGFCLPDLHAHKKHSGTDATFVIIPFRNQGSMRRLNFDSESFRDKRLKCFDNRFQLSQNDRNH